MRTKINSETISYENNDFWANEYFSPISTWLNVDSYGNAFLNGKARDDFYNGLIQGLIKQQKDFELYYNINNEHNANEILDEALKLSNRLVYKYSDSFDYDDSEYNKLYEMIKPFINKFNGILESLHSECYDKACILEFLNDYTEDFLSNDMWFDENYVLYKKTIISYA